jgi:hypothetical protein
LRKDFLPNVGHTSSFVRTTNVASWSHSGGFSHFARFRGIRTIPDSQLCKFADGTSYAQTLSGIGGFGKGTDNALISHRIKPGNSKHEPY